MGLFDLDDGRDSKRTLGLRDKQILWERAKHRCENPKCGKMVTLIGMLPGHKKAWSRGGRTTLANSVCLCYECNKLQGNDSWEVFLRKLGVESPEMKAKQAKAQITQTLGDLSLRQVKLLASKHHVKVTGSVEEGLFSSRRKAPTKQQYIKKLSGVVTSADLRSVPKEPPKPAKKKARRKSSNSWF